MLVAGDVYDRAVPPTDAVALLDEALAAFAARRHPGGAHQRQPRLGGPARVRVPLSERGRHPPAHRGRRTSPARSCSPTSTARSASTASRTCCPTRSWPSSARSARTPRCSPRRSARIRADAAARGLARTVVVAHAFVTGGAASESERDIRVGGIGDAPAACFAGCQLRGPRPPARPAAGRAGGAPPPVLRVAAGVLVLRAHHPKSVTLAEIDGAGRGDDRAAARRRCRGRCARCAAASTTCSPGPDGLADLAGAWVQGGADRPGPAGRADGAAAREVAAHARARLRSPRAG